MGLDLVTCGSVLADRYEITALLHSSSTIRVWEANDPILERAVIVETMDPRCTNDERNAFIAAALRNARCAHHGVVRVYDTGTHNGTTYIVSELVRGEALDHRIARLGPIPIGSAASIATGIAEALAAAHAAGLVHGALRAGNVLITADERVKISGFGAPSPDDRYRIAGEPPSAAADVYALAVLCVEMHSGEPFDPRRDDVTATLAQCDDVPERVQGALRRSLDPDPQTRAAHVRALDRAYEAFRTAPAAEEPTAIVAATIPPHDDSTQAVAAVREPAPIPEPLAPGANPVRTTVLIIVIVLIVGGIVGVVGALIATGNAKLPGSTTTSSEPQPIPIRGARDLDPLGDNGEENRVAVPRAVDGNPDTVWSTETYVSADFGGGKAGVGLRIDLADRRRIQKVLVNTTAAGWSASVYVGDGAGTTLAAWGSPAATITGAPADAAIAIPGNPQGQAVLVWFTRLPESGRLDVSEVQVLG